MLLFLPSTDRGREVALAAAALPHLYNMSGHHRMLDLAGGNGTWSIAATLSQPYLRATVVVEPGALATTRKRITSAGLETRIDITTLGPRHEPALTGHDLLLVRELPTHSVTSHADYGTRLLLTGPHRDPTITDTEICDWLRQNGWHLLRTGRLSNKRDLIVADATGKFPEPG